MMKKIIAIIMAAAMVMPTAAFGSTVTESEGRSGRSSGPVEEEDIDEDSIEEAVENFFSSLGDLIDEWGSAFQESEDAEYEAEDEESGQYQAYDVIIEGILEDIRDTIDRLTEDFYSVIEEIEELMDRTNASSRDFLRMVVPDTDGDDEALEDALNYYYNSIVDGIIEIVCDEILANVLDTALDTLGEIVEDWEPFGDFQPTFNL